MQKRILCHVALAAIFATGNALAQQPAPPAAAPASADAKTFSQQALDELMAPIALYPDALLAQVLMASTYPLEIVEAARFAKANANLKDKALEEALKDKTWDASVKSLVMLPQVITMMSEKLEWTQKLGDAVLAQQADVMKTAQNLRKKAQEAGNLKSSPEVVVKQEKQADQTVVVIESAKPETVYVPTYNPATAYGAWPYPAPPPYYYYPPGYAPGAAFWTFTAGVIVGGALWGNMGWGNNDINIDIDRQNNFNRNTSRNVDRSTNNKFQHKSEHRKGVAYQNQGVANQHNRGASTQNSQARSQYGGREGGAGQGQARTSDFGGGGAGGMDRGGGGGSPRAASTGSHGGFSGAGGSRASAQAASSRGSASRGGGGARGGGGGRRR